MNAEKFDSYLSERYHPQIAWYDQKSLHNQKMYKYLQFLLILFSSLTPILIVVEKLEGLKSLDWLFWVPAVTAVLVAILTALIKTYQFQENWINYRTTCETLKKELYFYDAGLDEYQDAENRESLFVDRVENLISRENTIWLSVTKQDKTRK